MSVNEPAGPRRTGHADDPAARRASADRLEDRVTRRRLSSFDLASLLLASGFCIIQFLRLHALIGPSAAPTMAFLRDPHATPTAAMGWWAWWDQGRYQSAAVAWAHGVTTARFHWYMPAYPLLGAPFVGLTPADPFLVPDLACLIGTLWLFSALASRLLDDIKGSVPLACLLFVASTLVLPDRVLWAWVVPWTTTPETLCLFAALLAAVRLLERPRRRDAFLLGLAGVAIAGVRPVEAMIVLLLAGVVTVPVLLARRMLRPDLLAAALVGGLLPLGLFGAAYLAVWGPRLSPYVISSANIGFEPRLLPIRWVTLMIDPRPLYPDGRGLAEVFFWIAPGFAGMAATLVGTRRTLLPAHILVVATMCADIVLFLIYRDLHPTGLWRFGSFHYFKWTLPLFALYALRLPLVLTGSHGSARSRSPPHA